MLYFNFLLYSYLFIFLMPHDIFWRIFFDDVDTLWSFKSSFLLVGIKGSINVKDDRNKVVLKLEFLKIVPEIKNVRTQTQFDFISSPSYLSSLKILIQKPKFTSVFIKIRAWTLKQEDKNFYSLIQAMRTRAWTSRGWKQQNEEEQSWGRR